MKIKKASSEKEKRKLEDIGFYTLCDSRAHYSSVESPLWRCELILTDRCNFSCPYCRGLRSDCRGDRTQEEALTILRQWFSQGLVNVRFSGGEPTLWRGLSHCISACKQNGVKRIALSTNGSAQKKVYEQLLLQGVNDFSISLDGGCCAIGEQMNGGNKSAWERSIMNIQWLAKQTYVTVGMVFNEQNIESAKESVLFAHGLGVSDIRIISSAQYNQALSALDTLDDGVLDAHPILKYRVSNMRTGISVRGLSDQDAPLCRLVLDDIAVAGKWHFPCIIYLREGGNPIGETIDKDFRQKRYKWMINHDPRRDPICRHNCLDVCRDYNNKANSR